MGEVGNWVGVWWLRFGDYDEFDVKVCFGRSLWLWIKICFEYVDVEVVMVVSVDCGCWGCVLGGCFDC